MIEKKIGYLRTLLINHLKHSSKYVFVIIGIEQKIHVWNKKNTFLNFYSQFLEKDLWH